MSEVYEPSADEIAAIRNTETFDAPAPVKRPAQPKALATRAMPANVDAEKGVISAMLLAPDYACGICAEKKVTRDLFMVTAHQVIFDTIMELWDKGTPIDVVVLSMALHQQGMLDTVGAAYVADLFTFMPTAANVKLHIEIIQEAWIKREQIKTYTELAAECYEPTSHAYTTLEQGEQRVLAIRNKLTQAKTFNRKAVAECALQGIYAALESDGAIIGCRTGFTEMDFLSHGLQDGLLYIIGARPSAGKTGFAMNVAEYMACEEGRPVLVFSLEMSAEQLLQRLICSRARVNLSRVANGRVPAWVYERLKKAKEEIEAAPFFIEDEPGISIQDLKAKARRMKQQHDVEAIFVDYLQLVKSNTKRARENRVQEVSEVSEGLKNTARETQCPVMALAQISREFERRAVKRPTLSDLRESGSIEQDADFIGFLVRPEMHCEREQDRLACKGDADLIVAKNRGGAIGDIALTFEEEYVRFHGREQQQQDPQQEMSI